MSRTKNISGVITMDFRPFIAAMRRAGETLARMAHSFTPSGRLASARHHHGGNGTDARRWPDEWQSAVCSAWLHESCPSDTHSLSCTCTCHRRRER